MISTVNRRPSGLGARGGFTLIELLIVIAIIGILISLLTVGIREVKKKAKLATAQSDISKFVQALASYNSDVGLYPGFDLVADESELSEFNAFPALFKKLYYDKSEGGGPNGPYVELKGDNVAVEDLDDESGFVVAKKSELRDPDVEKYYLDPWGTPYFYRENSAKRTKKEWMINRSKYDLWSAGPDEMNLAWQGSLDEEDYELEEGQVNDDIGNW